MRRPSTMVLARSGAALALALGAAAAALSVPAPLAAADTSSCVPEAEPNDAASAASATGGLCIDGTLPDGDTDIVSWEVAPADALTTWTIAVDGVADTVTTVALWAIVSDPGFDPPTLGDMPVYRIDTAPDATSASSPELIVPAGRWAIAVTRSDPYHGPLRSEPRYRLRVTPTSAAPPTGDVEPNDDPSSATPVADAFSLSGDLRGSDDWYAWTVKDPAIRWELEAQVAPADPVTIDLLRADGTLLTSHATQGDARLYDLALEPGTYLVHVSPWSDAARPYRLAARAGDADGDPEPNDDSASAIPLVTGDAVRGRLARQWDDDRWSFDVPDGSPVLLDARLLWRGTTDRRLCLIDATDVVIQCADGNGPGALQLGDLLLTPGHWILEVSGTADPADRYLLGVVTTVPPSDGAETEPNDTPATARLVPPDGTISGRANGREVDVYRIHTDGTPSLWEVTVDGEGLTDLRWTQPDGAILGAGKVAADGGHARLTDLYLSPGDHFIEVRSNGGPYTVHAVSLGPPDPDGEHEPNSDDLRAEDLRIGDRRTGRLVDDMDVDTFRFTVSTRDHVAFHVAQPPDLAARLRIWGSGLLVSEISGRPPGTTLDADLVLDPGDYRLELRAEQPSEGRWTLTTERLDPFTTAIDQEPDDSPSQAVDAPSSLEWDGSATWPDIDLVRLPPLADPGALHVAITGDGARVRIATVDGLRDLDPAEDGTWDATGLPAGVPVVLAIDGNGAYHVTVTGSGLEPRPDPGPLPVTMALAPAVEAVAAYLPQAQTTGATLQVRNDGTAPLTLTFEGRASAVQWSLALPADPVVVGPGETASVPVAIGVRPDAWAGEPVRLTVRARDVDGRAATTSAPITASGDAPALQPAFTYDLPPELAGGLDVAATAFGAVPAGTIAGDGEAALYDGVVLAGSDAYGLGLRVDGPVFPVDLVTDLAGDEPVPVAGMTVDPTALDLRLTAMPDEVELLLSDDAVTWTSAVRGRMRTWPEAQAFVLPAPLSARYAMLRVHSVHGPDTSTLAIGEWAVIAAPGWILPGLPSRISDPTLGGHAVRFAPAGLDANVGRRMLTAEDGWADQVRGGETLEVVIGFRADRVARIARIGWKDVAAGDPAHRIATAHVAVTTGGATGPWTELGDWPLERAPDGTVAPFELPVPVDARFVRIRGDVPKEAGYAGEVPDLITVDEAAPDAGHPSILAEWGARPGYGPWDRTAAAVPLDPIADPGAPAPGHDPAATATDLPPGVTAAGRVALGITEDWYAIEIPEGAVTFDATVSGATGVGVRLELVDTSGAVVPTTFGPGDGGTIVYHATVTPGRYRLHVTQPPFSAVFAFDTSGSMGPYLDRVLQGVRSFAGDVRPGHDAVQIVPFEQGPLLPGWSDDAYAIQAAIGGYVNLSSSSAAETGLIDSLKLLAGRDGARAIVLVTDALTSSADRGTELWQAIDAIRPAIFTVHVGGGDDLVGSRALMDDWAGASGGYAVAPASIGELGRAFDRAATWLRRPATYGLTWTASSEPLEPGTIAVAPPSDGSVLPVASDAAVGIVLDTSGSMSERLGRKRRIDVAVASLTRLVRDVLPEGVPVALRTFGGRGTSKAARCQTTLSLPLGPLDRSAALEIVRGLRAVPKALTPLGASLEAIAADLDGVTGPRTLVLITDGAETCHGDVAAVIDELRASGIDVHLNIVGLALDDDALRAQMTAWANAGGGAFADATDEQSLGDAIAAAVNAPFRVLAPDGSVVAGGTVGGPAVPVPPGTWRIEVASEPPVTYAEVVVQGGEHVAITLSSTGLLPDDTTEHP